MSETEQIDEDQDDSMEPGELKLTPPGSPTQNSSEKPNENEQNVKNEGDKVKSTDEKGKSHSSLDILKTYQNHGEDRYKTMGDMAANPFYENSYGPMHPNQMMMSSRGYGMFRGGNRGVKARLGFRGNHRGSFFPGRGRGYSRRGSVDNRDFRDEKKQFKLKLIYTKTKPSLSWHPNSKCKSPFKLDVTKRNNIGDSKSSDSLDSSERKSKTDKKKSDEISSKNVRDLKSKKNDNKDKEVLKKKRREKSREKRKSEKEDEKNKNGEKEEKIVKEKSLIKDKKFNTEEKSNKKREHEGKSKSGKSSSLDKRNSLGRKLDSEERKEKIDCRRDEPKISRSPERTRKPKQEKNKRSDESKKEKSKIFSRSKSRETSKAQTKRSVSKEINKSNEEQNKINIENKEDNISKHSESNIANNSVCKEKTESNKVDNTDDKTLVKPHNESSLSKSSTPKQKPINDIERMKTETDNIFPVEVKAKPKSKRNSKVNTSSLSFSDELLVYEEEPEDVFPLTKDETIKAIDEKNTKNTNIITEHLKSDKTDDIENTSSPDTEDYQDMWEEDEDLLTSSQLSENKKLELKGSSNPINHQDILKNIKVEIDEELEIIKRHQDVLQDAIFKNLNKNPARIKIKQERISTEEKVKIKKEKKSDESSSSSDESDNESSSSSNSSSGSDSSTSTSSTSGSNSNSQNKKNSKSSMSEEEEIKDGFRTPLFVNPSPPPDLQPSSNITQVLPSPKTNIFSAERKSVSKEISSKSKEIQDSIEEIMEQSEISFMSRKNARNSPAKNYFKVGDFGSSIEPLAVSNQNNLIKPKPNEEKPNPPNQKFVIAMNDIYEQFLQSVSSAGVDLSCDVEVKSSKDVKNSNVNEQMNKDTVLKVVESSDVKLDNNPSKTKVVYTTPEKTIQVKSGSKNSSEKFQSEFENDFDFEPELQIKEVISPVQVQNIKPKKIHNIIPLDEIGIIPMTNKELKTEVNSLKLSELNAPQFDVTISPKVEESTILLAPENLPIKLPNKSPISFSFSHINEKITSSPAIAAMEFDDDSTSSSSDSSDDSDSDDSSSESSESDVDNPRSILGVDTETLKKFTPEDRKNLRALEKRLNTLQGWSAGDEDDKEVFKGLKNILEREIELIIRKYIPLAIKPLKPLPKESPKEDIVKKSALKPIKPITINSPAALTPSKTVGILDPKPETAENIILSANKFLSFPTATIFSIGAEMAKNVALQRASTMQNNLVPSITEQPKPKEDLNKSSSKSSTSSRSARSDYDKKRKSKSPSDRSHKSSSKRSTHSPSQKSPTKHFSKECKNDRPKSPHSRDDRRKSSPHHKNSNNSSSRRNRVESPNKKSSSRQKHRRSSSASRSTPTRSRSPINTSSKRFRARTPSPPRSSKTRVHEKGINKSGNARKLDTHRSRSFSRSRSRSLTPRDAKIGFRGHGRLRGSISPIRRSFSPRRSMSPRRSNCIRKSASPRGRHFSRSPIPFRPPSPSVSPPPSGNDSSRSPKYHSRSLSRSRSRSCSPSPHTHKIRRLEMAHHSHWSTDSNNSNHYYAENTYGYATSPSRMTMPINSEVPRRIDTVIGSRIVRNDPVYSMYGQYSGYDYIQPNAAGMPQYHFDFNTPPTENNHYANNEASEYYYHQDFPENRNYTLSSNHLEPEDAHMTNATKSIAVQKGNVLEIVPSAVLPNDLDSSVIVETVESVKSVQIPDSEQEKKDENATAKQNCEPKKKKTPSWRREVNRRQMLAAVLKLHRDSDGNMKSILIKPDDKPKEKKRVLFADGIQPGNAPNEEKTSILKKEKRPKKDRKDRRKNKALLENKENSNISELLLLDETIDPELENAPPPPPPSGSPSPHLEQPIYLRPDSPPDFTYFHFDGAVNCMYFSKNPMPIPPRLLNGSFPSPPRAASQQTQHLQQNSTQVPLQMPPQAAHYQAVLPMLHQQQLPPSQNLVRTAAIGNNNSANVNATPPNILSLSNATADRLNNSMLIQNRKLVSPNPNILLSANNFPPIPSATGVRTSLVNRLNTVAHFGPSNTSMSSCNFSIPPPNIPPPMLPSQHNHLIGAVPRVLSPLALSPSVQNQTRSFIQQQFNNPLNVVMPQSTPTLEQIKRATATLPFQATVQGSSNISVISSDIVTSASPSIFQTNNSPAFSSDSCFWKGKDNSSTSSKVTILPSASLSPVVGVQQVFRTELKSLTSSSPNPSSPGQSKM